MYLAIPLVESLNINKILLIYLSFTVLKLFVLKVAISTTLCNLDLCLAFPL